MLYYMIDSDMDNKSRRVKDPKTGKVMRRGIWVADELYTAKEISKYIDFEKVSRPVNVSKRRIFWFFGARFAEEGAVKYVNA